MLNKMLNKVLNNKIHIYLIFSFILLLFISKTSFLYGINDWIDANTYTLMGRGILDGKLLYRDMVDHKGPYIYFLHALACMISRDSFIGVFILQIVACTFSMYFIDKILKLIVSSDHTIFTCLFTAMMYSSNYFNKGDSAEEWALPMILYMVYVGVKSITLDEEVKNKELLIIGITSGILFWLKFTICIVYVGFALYFTCRYIKQKKYKQLILSAALILLGVIISTLPIVIYFALNSGLNDLIDVYFKFNFMEYGPTLVNDALVVKTNENKILLYVIRIFLQLINCPWLLLVFLGLLIEYRKYNLFVSLVAFCSTYSLFFSGFFNYYFFIFGIYIIFSAPLLEKLNKHINFKRIQPKVIKNIILFIVTALCIITNANVNDLKTNKDELPQYKIAEIIAEEDDQSLICYGFGDYGVHTILGNGPSQKYTILPNFCSIQYQEDYIQNKEINFIITTNNYGTHFDGYTKVYEGQFYHSFYTSDATILTLFKRD